MKTTHFRHSAQPRLAICPTFEGEVGHAFSQYFPTVTPLLPNLPNLFGYIKGRNRRGREAPSANAENRKLGEKVGQVGQIDLNAMIAIGKTLPNLTEKGWPSAQPLGQPR